MQTTPSFKNIPTTGGANGTAAWVNGNVAYSELVGTPSLLGSVATSGSYIDLINKPSLVDDISDLADVDTQSTPPTTGQVLKWDGTPRASQMISLLVVLV